MVQGFPNRLAGGRIVIDDEGIRGSAAWCVTKDLVAEPLLSFAEVATLGRR